jgi:hypothetical protein
MNDAAAYEQPHYMERCREMSFAQLRRFIENALEIPSGSSVPDNEEHPRSQEELLTLCDMLRAKADAMKKDAPFPEPPNYHGPENPGPFTPSYELRSLYNKRERYEKHVDDAYSDGSQVLQEWTERQLKEMEERELAPVEEKERRRHDKLVAEYQEARKPYRDRYLRWEAKREKRREGEANREATVRRLYRKVNRASKPKTITILPWEIAAPGEGTEDRAVYEYYREVLSRGGLYGFDEEHLGKILALPRSDLMKGKAGWYGYIGLRFAHTNKILLDCPVPDNAVYVLDSGEERLLKMNKQQLRASGETKRIFHTGDWYQRVKRELGIT